MPAIMIAGAGHDSVFRLKAFEIPKKFWKDIPFVDDEITREGDEINGVFFELGFDLLEQFLVRVGAVVDVGELRDAEPIEGFGPTGKSDVLFGD